MLIEQLADNLFCSKSVPLLVIVVSLLLIEGDRTSHCLQIFDRFAGHKKKSQMPSLTQFWMYVYTQSLFLTLSQKSNFFFFYFSPINQGLSPRNWATVVLPKLNLICSFLFELLNKISSGNAETSPKSWATVYSVLGSSPAPRNRTKKQRKESQLWRLTYGLNWVQLSGLPPVSEFNGKKRGLVLGAELQRARFWDLFPV